MSRDKARYWICTWKANVPAREFLHQDRFCEQHWKPYVRGPLKYVRGQLECGEENEFVHWQFLLCFSRQVRLTQLKRHFLRDSHWPGGQKYSEIHAEPSRSDAVSEYVWKEETRIGFQFEFGSKPVSFNNKTDWDSIRDSAKAGDLESLPAQIYVTHYRTLKQIEKDHLKPKRAIRTIKVIWGPTGVGKSRRAWSEAGWDAYPKDPRTKFWDGYQGQDNVVIDEFRGGIDVSHILRWFDEYPVNIETKFGGCVFNATSIWVTSNIHPSEWYPQLDSDTLAALLRRLEVIHMTERIEEPEEPVVPTTPESSNSWLRRNQVFLQQTPPVVGGPIINLEREQQTSLDEEAQECPLCGDPSYACCCLDDAARAFHEDQLVLSPERELTAERMIFHDDYTIEEPRSQPSSLIWDGERW